MVRSDLAGFRRVRTLETSGASMAAIGAFKYTMHTRRHVRHAKAFDSSCRPGMMHVVGGCCMVLYHTISSVVKSWKASRGALEIGLVMWCLLTPNFCSCMP